MPLRLVSCSLLRERARNGTRMDSDHSVPMNVPNGGKRNGRALTGMMNSMASQNSRRLERPLNSPYPSKNRLTALMRLHWWSGSHLPFRFDGMPFL